MGREEPKTDADREWPSRFDLWAWLALGMVLLLMADPAERARVQAREGITAASRSEDESSMRSSHDAVALLRWSPTGETSLSSGPCPDPGQQAHHHRRRTRAALCCV